MASPLDQFGVLALVKNRPSEQGSLTGVPVVNAKQDCQPTALTFSKDMCVFRFAFAILLSLSCIIQGIYYAGSPNVPFSVRPFSKLVFDLGNAYGFWLVSTPFLLVGFGIPYILLFRKGDSPDNRNHQD